MGRERELTDLGALLRRRNTRLLSLVGPAGVGKTRLVLEYARRQSGGVPVLVELAPVAEGGDLVQAVAGALGVGERADRTGVETVVHALSGHRVLLLADNCEHVADDCARLLATLLERCPGLQVLATSREVLRVPGEVVVRLGALEAGARPAAGDPAGPRTAAEPVMPDAVRLFADRAIASAPGFRMAGEEAVMVGEICHRLDGMPLAIELAARRTASMPLETILAGLEDQLALLAGGSRTGPARHVDLIAAIGWSHRLLQAPEKALLRRVSVLRDGFTVEAAAAVAADGPDGVLPARRILPLLLELEAKSLLVRVPAVGPPEASVRKSAGEGEGHRSGVEPDALRYRLLEAVRAYALERLEEAGETEEMQRRAVTWLVGLVDPVPGPVYAECAPGAPLAEQGNLAAAIAVLPGPVGEPGGPPPELVLALARIRFHQDQLCAARALLEAGPEWPDGSLQIARLSLATRVSYWQADVEAALRSGARAVELAHTLDDPTLLALALDARGAVRMMRREWLPQAVEDYRASATTLADLGRPVEAAAVQQNLAWALLLVHRPAEADALMTGCLPVLREHALPYLFAAALHTAGVVRLALEDWPAAQELFAESLRTVPVDHQALDAVEGLAAVAVAQGEHRRAVRLFTAAARIRTRVEREIEPGWQERIAPFLAAAALPRAARSAAEISADMMSWSELVAYALGEAGSESAHGGTDGPVAPLTARETTVAQLIAQGLTNRQIAARLRISPCTVATRLDSVRDKLGLRSRTQIAMWLSRQTAQGCVPQPAGSARMRTGG